MDNDARILSMRERANPSALERCGVHGARLLEVLEVVSQSTLHEVETE
jgi:hypothetical protein